MFNFVCDAELSEKLVFRSELGIFILRNTKHVCSYSFT